MPSIHTSALSEQQGITEGVNMAHCFMLLNTSELSDLFPHITLSSSGTEFTRLF